MAEPTDSRVAVYIDFDNIVISRFAQVTGDRHTKIKDLDPSDSATGQKLALARVDLGTVLDFASSFGTIALTRAYADWSVSVNATYSSQLINRAIDLVQLFPTVGSGKNGADIRLALDVTDDLSRFPHLTHVVIVAGDSDYIALAQKCKQLGRYVVGIGVNGSVAPAFANSCDEFKYYDTLPGVSAVPTAAAPARKRATTPKEKSAETVAKELLVRAMQLAQDKNPDDWQPMASIKNQMLRLDPTFQERALGFKTFTDFVQSLADTVELDAGTSNRKMRLRS